MSFDQGEKPSADARMMKSIPGTEEHKAMHGDTGGLSGERSQSGCRSLRCCWHSMIAR
jgi:hypothetical protein